MFDIVLRLVSCLVAVCSLSLQEGQAFAQKNGSDTFRPIRVIPPRKPITDPPILDATNTKVQLEDNELVLGVIVNEKARAYPINAITGPSREIINDILGDVPIAATWCHLCHNTVVFEREVDKQTLTFAVSGKLWNRNLVMVDSETESLWSHFLGKAMDGPMKGTKLQTLPSKLTTWGQWLREHEDTTVLAMPYRVRQYVKEFYRKPEDFVYGFVVKGHTHHATFAFLEDNSVLNLQMNGVDLLITFDTESTGTQIFDRSIDGEPLTFNAAANRRMIDQQTETIWDRDSGIAIEGPLNGKSLARRVGMPAYAVAWKKFHPESVEVEQQDRRSSSAPNSAP